MIESVKEYVQKYRLEKQKQAERDARSKSLML